MTRRRVAALALLAALWAAPAAAKTTRELAYGYEPVWSTLVRFLRVDEKLKIVEKDAESGYVLFELSEGKKTFSGAAELMKVSGGTRLTIRIAERPAYMELGLLDRFEAKLQEELGQPVPPPAPPPAPPPEDKKP